MLESAAVRQYISSTWGSTVGNSTGGVTTQAAARLVTALVLPDEASCEASWPMVHNTGRHAV